MGCTFIALLMIVIFLVLSGIITWAWNILVPAATNNPNTTITYFQAMAITAILYILRLIFGGRGSSD